MIFDQKAKEFFQLMSLYHGLSMEVKHNVRMWRGRTAYSLAKETYSLKGNKKRVFAQVTDMYHRLVFERNITNLYNWAILMEAKYQRDFIQECCEEDTPELRADFHNQFMAILKGVPKDAIVH